ncbi:MAG: hypothetical protein UT24_C0012G0142 [Candidatus Woesebacteria bacterium GW2011_GWB1_39_12]|uniref:Uncharacterized protein n=2 Tax=Candidatus Woeseibacteriota TaxID=1752722 RepID=A0A0G0Q791_9BACT|nr:MAG: hypothetical protein UT23_C0011G0017 [Candidatus Woesebacteria bacterium GW2011_GWA1_39_12]KKR00520.1 MAG: hypothetical protein UT24_C0012G0142 [Candidatus Woesebacteria bacterium GW2011_GWB1_39_12]
MAIDLEPNKLRLQQVLKDVAITQAEILGNLPPTEKELARYDQISDEEAKKIIKDFNYIISGNTPAE